MRTLWGDDIARFGETACAIVTSFFSRKDTARFGETDRTLSGDEEHALRRRIARFGETNSTL